MIVKNNISKTWKILELEVAAQMELFVRKTSASYSPPFPKIPVSARWNQFQFDKSVQYWRKSNSNIHLTRAAVLLYTSVAKSTNTK